jgi:hypothetical protein
MDRTGSELGQMAGTCKCGNEASGSVKELPASSFTFSMISILVIDSFLS